MDIKLRQRVRIRESNVEGEIVGTATVIDSSSPWTCLIFQTIVLLDKGFYDPARSCYITMVVVHPDNIIEVE